MAFRWSAAAGLEVSSQAGLSWSTAGRLGVPGAGGAALRAPGEPHARRPNRAGPGRAAGGTAAGVARADAPARSERDGICHGLSRSRCGARTACAVAVLAGHGRDALRRSTAASRGFTVEVVLRTAPRAAQRRPSSEADYSSEGLHQQAAAG